MWLIFGILHINYAVGLRQGEVISPLLFSLFVDVLELYLQQDVHDGIHRDVRDSRLSVHPLRMQTGRYGRPRIVPEERYCLCCGARDIEDEYHFICICSCYVVIRRKYLHKDLYQNPSMFKLLTI